MKKLYLALFSFAAVGISNAQISSFPHTEDFESFATCGTGCGASCVLSSNWVNSTADNLDWLTDVGGTSSTSTGPSVDHTLGTASGNYLYVETSCSGTGFPSMTADLESPVFDFSLSNDPKMDFWYHMFGSTMGNMEIDASNDGGVTWTDVPVSIGGAAATTTPWTDNVDAWQLGTADLGAFAGDANVIVRFRLISGSNFYSDAAIDDINVYDLIPVDAGISDFYSPTSPACNTNADVWVEITNYGSNDLTSATIEWSQNAVMQTPVSWTGLLVQGQSDSVNLGTLTIANGDVLEAYTTFPNFVTEGPSGAGNDTTSITIGFGLNGTYSIDGGGAGDYIDFNSAVADLMTLGACGNVIFEVEDGTYNEQVLIGEYAGAGVTGNVTFVGANGAASAVNLSFAPTLSTDNYVVGLNGADFVTFKHLNIISGGTTYGTVINFLEDSDDVTIDSCVIQGDQSVSTTSTNMALVYASSGTNRDNFHITNSTLANGSYSVYFYGNSTSSFSNGFTIENCDLQNFYYRGLHSYYNENVSFRNNFLSNNASYTGSVYLMYLYYNNGTFEVSGNDVQHKLPAYGYGIYMSNCTGDGVNGANVFNNSFAVGNPATTSTSYGIYATAVSNTNFNSNSINISSNGTSSRCLYMTGGVGNNVMNNNMMNDGPGYGIYLNGGFDEVDYNNVYAPNGNYGYFGTAHATLLDWQAATGLDMNSYSVDPMFPAFNVLTTCNDTLDAAGMADTNVVVDLIGQPRGAMPDIGAYEFEGTLNFSVGSDTSICGTDMITIGDVNSPSTWTWNNGATTNTIDVMGTQAGTYIATRASSCGTAVDTIVITQAPDPVAAFDTTQTSFTTVVFNNMSTDATSYLWDFGDGNTSTDEDPFHIYATGGVYTVTLTATGPCGTDVSTFTVELVINSLDELSANIEMFPNPATDLLTLNADQVLDASIEVYNVAGKLVLTDNIQGTTKSINVSNLEKGMYMIKITNDEGSSIQRLIVE